MIKRAIRIGSVLGGLIGLTAAVAITVFLVRELGLPDSAELIIVTVEILFISLAGAVVGAVFGCLFSLVEHHLPKRSDK